MPTPKYMTLVPHLYQPKGAAQIIRACQSPSRGILVGYGMGLGKKMQTVLAMYLLRDEPGVYLVLCPASIAHQWAQTIEGAFEEVSP